jgi:hypothetical protein
MHWNNAGDVFRALKASAVENKSPIMKANRFSISQLRWVTKLFCSMLFNLWSLDRCCSMAQLRVVGLFSDAVSIYTIQCRWQIN